MGVELRARVADKNVNMTYEHAYELRFQIISAGDKLKDREKERI